MQVLFSDEKSFDIDGVYNSQNDRVWPIDRADANEKGAVSRNKVRTKSNGLVGQSWMKEQ
jgi:hypothetical protein